MGISRLCQAKQCFRFHSNGFAIETRHFSATSSRKTAGASREEKLVAVESFVRKYMETHSGIFPKASHVHKEVRGSWYILKGILQRLKEKISENTQVQNHSSSGKNSNSRADSTASKAITSQHNKSEKSYHELTKRLSLIDDGHKVKSMDLFDKKKDDQPAVELENGHLKPRKTLSSVVQMVNQTTGILHNNVPNMPTSIRNRYNQPQSQLKLPRITPNVVSEGGRQPASCIGTRKGNGVAHPFMEKVDDQKSETKMMTNSNISSPNGHFEALSKTIRGNEKKDGEYNFFTDSMKELAVGEQVASTCEDIVSSRTDQDLDDGHIDRVQSHVNALKKLKQMLLVRQNVGEMSVNDPSLENTLKEVYKHVMTEDREIGDAYNANFDSKSKCSPCVPRMGTKHLNESQDALSREALDQNKVYVKLLLRAAEDGNIVDAFKRCGDILKFEVSGATKNFFKYAAVYFKTREGMQNALQTSDILVKGAPVIIEQASSSEIFSKKIPIPNLIGDPDVPVALVKNPTRTVAIKQLPHQICAGHIEEALSFCQSKITGFFIGSSNSVAYVEFETEDGKERALAKHTTIFLGKRMFFHRIDIPRTTVVRISNLLFGEVLQKLDPILVSCGKVRSSYFRSKSILDVHFSITEWPNMLNILNKLNRTRVGGYKLLAVPASVIPADVLSVLYSQPEERRHLKDHMLSLLQKLDGSALCQTRLNDSAAKFYGNL